MFSEILLLKRLRDLNYTSQDKGSKYIRNVTGRVYFFYIYLLIFDFDGLG